MNRFDAVIAGAWGHPPQASMPPSEPGHPAEGVSTTRRFDAAIAGA